MEAKMIRIPVRRMITRLAVLTSIWGRIMTLPETVPTVQTPPLAEAHGIRKEDKVAARFDILMGLYVLSALGRIEMTKDGRKLVFKKAAGKA